MSQLGIICDKMVYEAFKKDKCIHPSEEYIYEGDDRILAWWLLDPKSEEMNRIRQMFRMIGDIGSYKYMLDETEEGGDITVNSKISSVWKNSAWTDVFKYGIHVPETAVPIKNGTVKELYVEGFFYFTTGEGDLDAAMEQFQDICVKVGINADNVSVAELREKL